VPQEVFARLVALTDAMTKLADELNLPRHQTTQTVVSFWREWQQGESDWVTPEGR
jgi:hypothetical protein